MHGCLQRGGRHEGELRVRSCLEPVAWSVAEQFLHEERIPGRWNSPPGSPGVSKRLHAAARGLFLPGAPGAALGLESRQQPSDRAPLRPVKALAARDSSGCTSLAFHSEAALTREPAGLIYRGIQWGKRSPDLH